MTLRTIFTLMVMALLSCNFRNEIKENANNAEKEAKGTMKSELASAKTDFSDAYEKYFPRLSDSALSTNTTKLYQETITSLNYIDSLRQEMDKLDNVDIKNIESIKTTFLEKGIADSVINKVKYCYWLAINLTQAESVKKRLLEVEAEYSDETKKHLFEINSPMGVSMILFGIEIELLKDGTTWFSIIAAN